MGNTIDLCPQCRGKLVPIGERTGGFSAKKAVVGTVVAGGVVGLAAGATGKQLVTLKCVNCGYTIETDAKNAQEAVAFGEAYEHYCQLQDMLRKQRCKLEIPMVELLHRYGYRGEGFNEAGYINRKEERKKIGIEEEAIESNIKAIQQKYQEKFHALEKNYKPKEDTQQEETEIKKLSTKHAQLKKEQTKQEEYLSTLGFFKFSEKKATKEKIASMQEELQAVAGSKDALIKKVKETKRRNTQAKQSAKDRLKKQEIAEIEQARSMLVERCRVLAYSWMEEHLPKEYHRFLGAFYSVLSGEPMNYEEIHALLDPKSEAMTALQFKIRIESCSNPFVSCSGDLSPKAYYFGSEGTYDKRQMQIRELRESSRKALADGDHETYRKLNQQLIKTIES